MPSVYVWFILILFSLNEHLIAGRIFFVGDNGAYPDDNLDDTNGIQFAINEAIKTGLPGEIVFGFGNYKISSTIFITNATNLTIRGQGIDQTFLIGTNQLAIFNAQYSQGLKLSSFSIDYDPLPFTAGYVVDVNDQYLDVQVVPPHQTDVDRQVQAILRYDPIQMRPAFGDATYEMSQEPPTNANTSIVSPGILRLPLTSPTKFLKGDPIVARYIFRAYGIYSQDVEDITLQSLVIYTAWSMGFVTLRAKRINIIDYHVLPRNGRWMSTVADCMHFTHAREYVSISDSSCQAMGDDGLNVHGTLFLVTDVIDSRSITIEATKWTYSLDVGVGTSLEFSGNQQPFTVHGNGTIASIVFNSVNSRNITFTSAVNVNLGDWVCVADTPVLTIRNLTVANNRARGVLLETRNIDIRQSIFNRTSGPAVLFQPSMFWVEGPEARNVSLIENIYIENNEGIAQEQGIIAILPDPPQLTPVINDIRIESSVFYLGSYSQNILQSDNGNNIFLTKNYIAGNNFTSLITICNSRNITAVDNCVVTNETKIDQYYSFDDNKPCAMNLSSLIDLPASAFNSSFPPPVLRKFGHVSNLTHDEKNMNIWKSKQIR